MTVYHQKDSARASNSKAIAFLIFIVLLLNLTLSPQTIRAQQAPVFVDDFNNNTMNTSFWKDDHIGTGPIAAVQNQRLEITIPSTSTNDPTQAIFADGYLSLCSLQGDFNITVDYQLLTWPATNGVRIALGTTPISIERNSFGNGGDFPGYPREVYLTEPSGAPSIQSTTDTLGSLRLQRIGSDLHSYYMQNGNWVENYTYSGSTADTAVSLNAWSHDAYFAKQDVKVAFDNFIVQSGQVVCPQTSHTISGHITDSSKRPVRNAQVILNPSGRATTTTTEGYYEFTGVTQGNYTINAILDGWSFNQRTVSVPPSDTTIDLQGTVATYLNHEVVLISVGDSIAAGHGLSNNARLSGPRVQNPNYDPCRLNSTKSYPAILKQNLEARSWTVTFKHFACSGAFAKDPSIVDTNSLEHPHKLFANQTDDAMAFLESPEHNQRRKVIITITIGANNFPWTDGNALCSFLVREKDSDYQNQVFAITDQVASETSKRVQQLLQYPEVSIVIQGYPNPFNRRSVIFVALASSRCPINKIIPAQQMYKRTEFAVAYLNGSLDGQVVRSMHMPNRIAFANQIYAKFFGHESAGRECGRTLLPLTDPKQQDRYTWIQFPTDQESYSFEFDQYKSFYRYSSVDKLADWRGDCFHPNVIGHQMIAQSMDEKIQQLGFR